jgi:hypothetical protein
MIGKYPCQHILAGFPDQCKNMARDEYGHCDHEECKPDIRVRCNHCMSVVYEEYLIKDDSTDSGERCPVCNKSDAIMDITNL